MPRKDKIETCDIKWKNLLTELLPRRKRDKCNVLLSPDIDKIIQEECKINSRMDQVRGRINGVWKLIIWILRW